MNSMPEVEEFRFLKKSRALTDSSGRSPRPEHCPTRNGIPGRIRSRPSVGVKVAWMAQDPNDGRYDEAPTAGDLGAVGPGSGQSGVEFPDPPPAFHHCARNVSSESGSVAKQTSPPSIGASQG